jgi:PAS domain S-box-containing protein
MAAQIGLAVGNARLYLDLKASERRFRGLVENAEDVIYLTDHTGRIVYANPALDRLLGYGPDVLSSGDVPVLALVHPDDRARIADLLPRMLAGDVMRAIEFRVVHRDGSRVIWCSQTNVPLRDEAGVITGMQCIAQDVTTRKALEEQMVRAERLADLGRMAATIAHEIRNPLGSIVIVIRLLKQPSSSRDPRLLDRGRGSRSARRHRQRVLPFARPPRNCRAVREPVENASSLPRRADRSDRHRVRCQTTCPRCVSIPTRCGR